MPTEPRTEFLRTRLTTADRDAFVTAAESRGLTSSEALRQAANLYTEAVRDDQVEAASRLLDELHSDGLAIELDPAGLLDLMACAGLSLKRDSSASVAYMNAIQGARIEEERV